MKQKRNTHIITISLPGDLSKQLSEKLSNSGLTRSAVAVAAFSAFVAGDFSVDNRPRIVREES